VKQTHLVTILGREIPVKSSAPEAAVREVETFVNNRINEIRAKLTAADPQLVVTLAFLNLAEQYLSQQAGQAEATIQDTRLQELLGRIDAAL
jgi:cell division protein ZapA